jgi:hypothetical protein
VKSDKNDRYPTFVWPASVVALILLLTHFYQTAGLFGFVAVMIAPWFIAVILLYARDQVRQTSFMRALVRKINRLMTSLRIVVVNG